MNTKHTPGPWTPKDNCMAGGINHFAITSPGKDWMVCSLTPMRLKREQDVVNGNLIAAAPELLEVCKIVASVIPEWLKHRDPTVEELAAIRDELNRVIAKAEGSAA